MQTLGYREISAMQEVLAEEHRFENEFLLARRAEKDFLLRKDLKYRETNSAIAAEMRHILNVIEKTAPALVGGGLAEDISSLKSALEIYLAEFDALLQANIDLGLDEESGLQGTLRQAVRDAEESLKSFDNPVLAVKMLMMRRHEKDFIMRGDTKYVDRLNARVEEFRAFPLSEFPSAGVQKQIVDLITIYQDSFNEFASVYNAEAEARKRVSAAYAASEPFRDAIKNTIETADVEARAQAESFALYLTIATLLAVVATAAVFYRWAKRVARRTVQPWEQTSSVIRGLQKGTADIDQLRMSFIEVAAVADAFEDFQASLLEKGREEQKQREQARREVAEAEERARLEKEALAEKKRQEQEDQIARERKAVSEISAVVEACALGDFSRKVATHDKDGLIKQLCLGVNKIGDVADRGLLDVKDALSALASGNLGFRMDGEYSGVFKEISVAMNTTAHTLAAVVSKIDTSSESINLSTRELASASADLARRTEKNAAALEETAAATEELSASVSSTATTAGKVNGDVQMMRDQVEDSISVVTKTVDAMQGIRAASSEITKITSLIDDIAFQTNLLALNAGVEAARAGVAGKGFAVVATEVRELAARSAQAAKKISSLIEESAKQIENGGALVDDTGSSLQKIAGAVRSVVQDIEEIALSAQQQASTISEITSATSDLDRATQENAAMYEETAAASQSLQQEAQSLSEIVATFSGHEGLNIPVEDTGASDHRPEEAPSAA